MKREVRQALGAALREKELRAEVRELKQQIRAVKKMLSAIATSATPLADATLALCCLKVAGRRKRK